MQTLYHWSNDICCSLRILDLQVIESVRYGGMLCNRLESGFDYWLTSIDVWKLLPSMLFWTFVPHSALVICRSLVSTMQAFSCNCGSIGLNTSFSIRENSIFSWFPCVKHLCLFWTYSKEFRAHSWLFQVLPAIHYWFCYLPTLNLQNALTFSLAHLLAYLFRSSYHRNSFDYFKFA